MIKRGIALVAALTAGFGALLDGSGIASAEPSSGTAETYPITRVVPWHYGHIRTAPNSKGRAIDKVTVDDGYDAYCFTEGEKIGNSDYWVLMLGDARIQGYFPGFYLKGDLTGNVRNHC